ncbi:MAG TPA: hypothetical protein VFF65_03505, partial [Phycisphaerales bacterium]|nr:hypothetical protein [Phycisphaerales bacterium]
MRPAARRITLALVLGMLTSGASVFLIAYWPRSYYPHRVQQDRDRRPEAGEGRGFLAQRFEWGVGYSLASATASQQFITGGYNYVTTEAPLPWPDSVRRRASPWPEGTEPWPVDGVSRQIMVLRVGWPLAMLEGTWSQTITRPPPGARPGFPGEPPMNAVVTANWHPTLPMWNSYGGWAYINSPTWLKTSRLGSMLFDKSMLPAVPGRPLWLGVVVNTLVFSAGWWCAVTAVGRVRLAARESRGRGRCPHCRYPRAGFEPTTCGLGN